MLAWGAGDRWYHSSWRKKIVIFQNFHLPTIQCGICVTKIEIYAKLIRPTIMFLSFRKKQYISRIQKVCSRTCTFCYFAPLALVAPLNAATGAKGAKEQRSKRSKGTCRMKKLCSRTCTFCSFATFAPVAPLNAATGANGAKQQMSKRSKGTCS